jgi:biotin carboxyl carrier protein
MNNFVVSCNGNRFEITIKTNDKIEVDGEEYEYELIQLSLYNYLLRVNNKVYELSGERNSSEKYFITFRGESFDITVRTALQERATEMMTKAEGGEKKLEVRAPMPGMILKQKFKEGDEVNEGDVIVILEAMKMENAIKAMKGGRISKMDAGEGMAVEKGVILFVIETKVNA